MSDYPDINIDKVGLFTNRERAREAGVTGVPTLVYGDQKLSGFVLTKARIRKFFDEL